MKDNTAQIATLARSTMLRDYGSAFAETTGLPFAIRALESWQVPLHGQKKENSFCALMASRSGTCAACLQTQEKLCQSALDRPAATMCVRGLTEGAAPIRMGNRTIGFLQTGQVMRSRPSEAQFEKVFAQIEETKVPADKAELREAYFKTPIVPKKKFDSILQLLGIFADHLSLKSNEIALTSATAEPTLVTKAKQYIEANQAEPLTLDAVARASHTSKFNFCKIFKKATGLTFTDFLSRTRTEKAKTLLANANLRISEIAYDIGFQSLTHFNRVFRALTGVSPTKYRENLGRA